MSETPAIEPMPRRAAVLLVVLYHLDDLAKAGLIDVSPNPLPITEQGRQVAGDLVESGFKVTDDEMRAVLAMLTKSPGPAFTKGKTDIAAIQTVSNGSRA